MTTPIVAIRGATALVGESLDAIGSVVLVISGDEIVALGREGEVDIPRGAITFDASGTTLTPGFIDAHVHIGFYDPRDVISGGVTTVRDLGWPPNVIHALATRSLDRNFQGPEILAAGPILTAPGGYPAHAGWAPPGTAREVSDPIEARPAVQQTIQEGAAVVKVSLNPPAGPTFATSTLRAIVDAAHDLGSKVTGHVYGIEELERGLDAGMDELAHMLMSEERIPNNTIERMVAQGMSVVPTLSCRFGRDRALAVENTARFRKAGGHIVYGTDLGNEGPGPGIDELEVKAMSEVGLSVKEIIRGATVDAADWLGLSDRGILTTGRRADIVAFKGSLDDPKDLTDVAAVWKRGVLVRSEKLDG